MTTSTTTITLFNPFFSNSFGLFEQEITTQKYVFHPPVVVVLVAASNYFMFAFRSFVKWHSLVRFDVQCSSDFHVHIHWMTKKMTVIMVKRDGETEQESRYHKQLSLIQQQQHNCSASRERSKKDQSQSLASLTGNTQVMAWLRHDVCAVCCCEIFPILNLGKLKAWAFRFRFWLIGKLLDTAIWAQQQASEQAITKILKSGSYVE